jgi:hypothetical protein
VLAALPADDLRLLDAEQLRELALAESLIGAVFDELDCDQASGRAALPLLPERVVGVEELADKLAPP